MILLRVVPLILLRVVPSILLRLVLIASGKPSQTKSCSYSRIVWGKKGSQQGPKTQIGLRTHIKTNISNVGQDPKKVLSLIAF